jgi:hypothetical protein
MSKSTYCATFNKQIRAFFKQIKEVYPDLKEIKAVASQLNMALAMDETVAVSNFHKHLVSKYEEQIMKQDEAFFLAFDLTGTPLSDLNHLKNVYASATPNTKQCIWKYTKVLTVLSKKYVSC